MPTGQHLIGLLHSCTVFQLHLFTFTVCTFQLHFPNKYKQFLTVESNEIFIVVSVYVVNVEV